MSPVLKKLNKCQSKQQKTFLPLLLELLSGLYSPTTSLLPLILLSLQENIFKILKFCFSTTSERYE